MSRTYIQKILIVAILEFIVVFSAFFLAYDLRLMRDWIPFIQLPIPYISYDQFIPFIWSGVLLWFVVFIRGRLYTIRPYVSIIEEIRLVITYSFFWFFIYIGFIYLSTGFIFHKEIPRLVVFYTYLIATTGSIIVRYLIHTLYSILHSREIIKKESILIIQDENSKYQFESNDFYSYTYQSPSSIDTITELVKSQECASIIYLSELKNISPFLQLTRIYGIPLMYPKISEHIPLQFSRENWINGTPMIEVSMIAITPWGRIIKRSLDILLSSIGIMILIPLFLIISIGIWISDPTGPIIYRNRRIGQDGHIFSLYKFRYMYWKYCTKEDYNINDDALGYEEKLKETHNTREGPLYKITNDPRIMPWGRFIEKLSLDELPQLYNVLIGDMSLIGPRPHQPREIALYDESDLQVLTIKPGITGMAQVYGREKNTFKEEIRLDTSYIERYSLSLDIAIFLRTILVVLSRAWKK